MEESMGMMERAAATLDIPLYAIDDETAIKVVDREGEIVSAGEWRLFDKPRRSSSDAKQPEESAETHDAETLRSGNSSGTTGP